MAQEGYASRAIMGSAKPLPQAAGAMLHSDGSSGVCREVGPLICSGPGQRSAFQAIGQPVTGDGASPYWTTGAIGLVPSLSPQAIAWEQEAARLTFDLDPVLLTETAREVIPRATGELVWVHWQETAESCTPEVRPILLIHGPYDALEVDRVMIVPSLPAHDPLLQHLALVLQAAIEGEGVAGQLYAESLIDALVVHFLQYVIQPLNQTLACTVNLRFHVKQAGWNVRGPDFAPLQALFAATASELDAYTDLMAERIAVLGGSRGEQPTRQPRSRGWRSIPTPSSMVGPMWWRWPSASRPMPRRCGMA
jgi:hypothetical protein